MTDTARYINTTDTAKLLRAALKKAFPGVKFSVRSNVYSGGSSIDVSYTAVPDAPTQTEVNEIAKAYQAKRFDGSIDLSIYGQHWLQPDGTVSIAHFQGTTGSTGIFEEERNDQPEGAELVRFGSDYVFVRPEEPRHARPTAGRATRNYPIHF